MRGELVAERDLLASLRVWFVFVPLFGIFTPLLVIYGGIYNEYLITRYNLHANVLTATAICLLGVSLSSVSFLTIAQPITRSTRQRSRQQARPVFGAWILCLVLLIGLLGGGSPGRLYQNLVLLSSKARGVVEGQAYIYLILSVFMVLSIIVVIRLLEGRRSWSKRIQAALVIGFAVFICFAAGSRARGLAVVIAPIVYFLGRPRLKWLSLLPAALLFVFLFSFGDYLRREAQGRTEESSEGPLVLAIGSFSVVDGTAIAVQVATTAPESWLASLQTIFGWYLPSAWVGQKELIGSVTARYILEGDTLGGITFGTYGELYYYFGFPGLMLGSLIIGAFFGRLARCIDSSFSGLVAYCGVFYLIFLSARNGLFNDLIFFGIIVLLMGIGWAKTVMDRSSRVVRSQLG